MRAVSSPSPLLAVAAVVVGCALAAPARATEPVQSLLVDVPLVVSARPASSGVGTELLAWPSLRVGALWPTVGPLVVGGDLALSGTWAAAGTDVVSLSRVLGGGDARGLVGLSFGGRFARVCPYGYAGVFGAAGPSLVHGGATDTARLLLLGGVRGGFGVLFDIGVIGVRSELGGGVTGGRPEVTASVALGVSL